MEEPVIAVHDNPDRSRYEVMVDGAPAGFAAYRDDAGRRVFTHTRIDPDFEGQGIGGALARGALDDARDRQLRVVARCPFISGWIARHADYADLVDP